MEDSEYAQTDADALWSQIKHQNKRIELKRRCLFALPVSEDEQEMVESGNPDIAKDEHLPESLLREDDMFYETAKSCVAAALGVCDFEGPNRVFQDDVQLVNVPNLSAEDISSCVNQLTTKGLYRVATILMGGSAEFEKTRPKMKEVIRESLPKVFGNQIDENERMKISQELSQLLKNGLYFQGNYSTLRGSLSQRPRDAVRNVLDRLQDLPSETLFAMHRKLLGRSIVPRLQTHNNWSRKVLLNLVRRKCKKMLKNLGKCDELQEPLAKAMAVVGLSLKLIPAYRNCTFRVFHPFSESTMTLQNDIARAIRRVGTKSSASQLKKLKVLLDPNSKVSNRSLRTAIKKMLTEYLLECGDMVRVPEPLLKTLAVINGNSQSEPQKNFQKEAIEEEVEGILNVSAQVKQIVWDFLPDHDLDLDFDDAYMGKLEESDDDGNDSNDSVEGDGISGRERSHSYDSHSEAESTGDMIPFVCNPSSSSVFSEGLEPTLSIHGDSVASSGTERGFHGNSIDRHESESNSGMDTEDLMHVEPEGTHGRKTTCKNRYLTVQEACDETSMIAYNLISHMLEGFALRQGLNVSCDDNLHPRDCATQEDNREVKTKKTYSKERRTLPQENDDGSDLLRAVEDVIPSFPESEKAALRKLVRGGGGIP